jgi:hypothetical protein
VLFIDRTYKNLLSELLSASSSVPEELDSADEQPLISEKAPDVLNLDESSGVLVVAVTRWPPPFECRGVIGSPAVFSSGIFFCMGIKGSKV